MSMVVFQREKGGNPKPRKENPGLEGECTFCWKKCGETLLGANVDLSRLLYNFILLAIRTQLHWRTVAFKKYKIEL